MISKRCKYALKALRRLALSKDYVMKAYQIADAERIPKKFLEHILIDLRTHALIGSKKGAEGGYYLLKPASDIKLSDVYRIFDGAIAMVPCASEMYYEACDDCEDPDTCKLKEIFCDIRNKTYALMEKKPLHK
ncbi:MAG: Rrf2 family transcriptional regulator [Bacteroidetes bacterium]|nr:Rrf2 family transcriptional regulator [Bacteroidota bacterium]